MMVHLTADKDQVLVLTSSIATSDIRESGRTTVFMDMANFFATMSFSSRESSNKVFVMVWVSIVMRMVTFLKALSSGTRNVDMEATTLPREGS
jgi:hypothetical protein